MTVTAAFAPTTTDHKRTTAMAFNPALPAQGQPGNTGIVPASMRPTRPLVYTGSSVWPGLPAQASPTAVAATAGTTPPSVTPTGPAVSPNPVPRPASAALATGNVLGNRAGIGAAVPNAMPGPKPGGQGATSGMTMPGMPRPPAMPTGTQMQMPRSNAMGMRMPNREPVGRPAGGLFPRLG